MHIELHIILLLCLFGFLAGMVDAIVGGGGLIQLPAALILLPQYAVAAVIASLKVPSFCGTSFAAYQYSKKTDLNAPLLAVMMLIAGIASYGGSLLLTTVHNDFMKPVLLCVLIGVAVYTYTKKDFGSRQIIEINHLQQWVRPALISLVIGVYDGFIGPGAGSFLILGFITLIGTDFLHASAYAKWINLATNTGSIILFLLKGLIVWQIALPMAVSNAMGGMTGARMAIKKGNRFIRVFFLCIVLITLIRFSYDVFVKP